MSKNFLPKGKKGEDIAVSYLRSLKYQILDRNWKKRYGEIDIVALDGDTLVFVEVKTREESDENRPEEAMSPWKIRKLIQTAEHYKILHPELPDALRIDFVGVTLKEGRAKEINLIKSITE